jgi:hypothetical protein
VIVWALAGCALLVGSNRGGALDQEAPHERRPRKQ